MLIECTLPATPNAHVESTRPRKEHISIINHVCLVEVCACSVTSFSVSSTQFGNLDHRKPSILIRWILLKGESIAKLGNLVERYVIPSCWQRSIRHIEGIREQS